MRPPGWIALLCFVGLAVPHGTVAAQGAFVTDSTRAAIKAWVVVDSSRGVTLKPWAIPDRPENGSPWSQDRYWRGRSARMVVDSVLAVTWGAEWKEKPPAPPWLADCRPFQTELETSMPVPDEYWVFACAKSLEGGEWETRYYLLGDGSRLTQERTEWRIDFAQQAGESAAVATYRELEDSLAQRIAGSILSSERHEEKQLGWSIGRRFRTRQGEVWMSLALYGDPQRYTLTCGRQSPALARDIDRYWNSGDPLENPGAEVGRDTSVSKDLELALESPNHALARALRRSKPEWNDVEHFDAALVKARTGDAHDLVLLATHAWLEIIADSLGEGGPGWSKVVQRLSRRGIRFSSDSESRDLNHYCGSILTQLVPRAGENRWADEGFAQWLERGAFEECGCTGDRMTAVIEKGSEFLRRAPNSSAKAAVERAMAEAHETLWSLSLSKPSNEYSQSLALTGAAHRDQALSLYRDALRDAPRSWVLDLLRRRVRRIEIAVDTGQRAFVCWSD